MPEPARPVREEGTPSRHDWAGPGGTIVLFCCLGAHWQEIEGGSDLATLPSDEDVDVLSSFNLQKVGRVRQQKSYGEPFADRLEFFNEWLPWKSQDVGPTDEAKLQVLIRWKSVGSGKSSASVLVTPWLAYGCSVGSRVKTHHGHYATVTVIRDDDTCEMVRDNAKETKAGPPEPDLIDPRPDTVSRTSSSSYRTGQKLLLIHEGVATDASVEEWLGLRRGSRHKVRLGSKAEGKTGAAKAAAAAAASATAAPVATKGGAPAKAADAKAAAAAATYLEVDLNDSNHSKLLFPTVQRYEDARAAYCEKLLMGKHAVWKDDATGKDLSVADQRLYLKPFAPKKKAAEAKEGEAADEAKAAPEDAKGGRSTPPPPGGASPPPELTAAKDEAAPADVADTRVPFLSVFQSLVEPLPSNRTMHAPLLVRASSKVEHELMLNQATYVLASLLRTPKESLGPIKLAPIVVSMTKVSELMLDEAMAKQGARAVLVKAFENDYPGQGDMLRQMMDLKAVVIVVEVQGEAELAGLTAPSMLDELMANRLIITLSGLDAAGAMLEPPEALLSSCALLETASLGLYMSDIAITSRLLASLFRRMRTSNAEAQPSHYAMVDRLHLGYAEVGREGLQELQELLASDQCKIKSIDLSFAQVDCFPLVQALRGNTSLTSLDMRGIKGVDALYETVAKQLLDPNTVMNLCNIRCDAFDLVESDKALDLREERIAPVAVRLLGGLLKKNKTLLDLDLTAADVEDEGGIALASIFDHNQTLTKLSLGFNPALTEASKAKLRKAAELHATKLKLEL